MINHVWLIYLMHDGKHAERYANVIRYPFPWLCDWDDYIVTYSNFCWWEYHESWFSIFLMILYNVWFICWPIIQYHEAESSISLGKICQKRRIYTNRYLMTSVTVSVFVLSRIYDVTLSSLNFCGIWGCMFAVDPFSPDGWENLAILRNHI